MYVVEQKCVNCWASVEILNINDLYVLAGNVGSEAMLRSYIPSARGEKVTPCSFLCGQLKNRRGIQSYTISMVRKLGASREKHLDLENGKVRVSRVKRSDTGDE